MKAFLIFDFGSDEDSAQKARHRVDSWVQGFRLGKKLMLKFDRPDEASEEKKDAAKKSSAEKSDSKTGSATHVALRLDFSSHEKMSYHRWLERIPLEDPFKGLPVETVHEGDDSFAAKSDWFDALT